jgi:hypothetical protein
MHSVIKRQAGLVTVLLLAGATVPATAAIARAQTAGPASSLTVSGALRGVAATSARNAWAVGSTGSGRPLIVHWNGSTWAKVADPGFSGMASLTGVAAVSASDAWAVGSTSGRQTLILHWNGSTWGRVASPSPGPAKLGDSLMGVAATSGGNAWAVGSMGSDKALILHWDGSSWKQAPGSETGNLSAVAATSARSAWAVGSRTTGIGTDPEIQNLILRWNGTGWKRVPSPHFPVHVVSFLNDVTASSAHGAWAVGESTVCGCGPGLSLSWHWNGTAGRRVPSPSPGGGTSLIGVAAIPGSSGVWTVGVSGEGDSLTKTVILQWAGTAWKRVPSPSPRASSELDGVAAVSPRLAWAVGSASSKSRNGSTTVILRWDGTAWR